MSIPADAPRVKSLKVHIPMHLYQRLHALRIIGGRPCSEVVSEAVARYFAADAARRDAAGAALA